jgi:hypothetical protein
MNAMDLERAKVNRERVKGKKERNIIFDCLACLPPFRIGYSSLSLSLSTHQFTK